MAVSSLFDNVPKDIYDDIARGVTFLIRDPYTSCTVWTRETIFAKKKWKKMSGILRQWPLSLHRKTAKIAKYGSDYTNFENIAKIKNKLFYKYNIGGHFFVTFV